MFKVPEKMRLTNGKLGSAPNSGNNGAFFVHINATIVALCIVSDGLTTDWEHVSVTLMMKKTVPVPVKRCPTWEEMCLIKSVFWDETDCVVEFHPVKKDYISNHPYCLHLWRNIRVEFPTPPKNLVGV
jgi:hypothetical protein